MADTELTQLEPKVITVPVTCSEHIFGLGNKIEDPVFLKRLQHTPPLSPREVVKLALFLIKSPMNKGLADHLTEVALISIVSKPPIEPIMSQLYQVSGNIVEDLLDLWSDEPNLKRAGPSSESQEERTNAIFALSLLPGLALLVESRTYGDKLWYFAIGVGPDPATIPLE